MRLRVPLPHQLPAWPSVAVVAMVVAAVVVVALAASLVAVVLAVMAASALVAVALVAVAAQAPLPRSLNPRVPLMATSPLTRAVTAPMSGASDLQRQGPLGFGMH
jgi:ABC-type transport system involved in cytochrome bd biosynthesis fused ATPase/permease subunit